LPVRGNGAVAGKRGHHAFVAKILRPCLELLRRGADLFAKLHQRIAERVRVEIGQASRREGIAEYVADWPGPLPAIATTQANGHETAVLPKPDLRRREQRVVIAPKHGGA